MKTVLVLGAGLVTQPLVDYLLKHNVFVRVASRTVSKAKKLIGDHPNGEAVGWTVDKLEKLKKLIKDADLVVSLLPANYHFEIAALCIEFSTNMATTSYVSPEMRALDKPAKDNGIVILNECGVDPGIDHMSAMRIVHDVENKGGKITSFMSYCGGLPAPEANTNPFGYKFSWSPKGVLLAGKNNAKYRIDGKDINIEGKDLFDNHWKVDVPSFGRLEGYPNRNSLEYIETYGFEGINTMFRGTLRNPGWCETLKAIVDLNYVETNEQDWSGKTYTDMGWEILGKMPDGDLRKAMASKLGVQYESEILESLNWLGLFSFEKIPIEKGGPIDVLTATMLEKMSYATGERDMLVLYHNFIAEYSDGHKEEITSTMIDYGIPDGDSSMSRTVSLPAAIGVRLILERKFSKPGVWIPVIQELYNPILDELETFGIKCLEKSKTL
jgi:saccharopine dehydrogenase (NADP+, L-glutamate forming)/spermidine synthase